MSNEFAFTDTSEKLSTTLEKLIGKLQGQTITLRELMEAIGEQGLLLICAIASLPFLIPVSIPGVSTVFDPWASAATGLTLASVNTAAKSKLIDVVMSFQVWLPVATSIDTVPNRMTACIESRSGSAINVIR